MAGTVYTVGKARNMQGVALWALWEFARWEIRRKFSVVHWRVILV